VKSVRLTFPFLCSSSASEEDCIPVVHQDTMGEPKEKSWVEQVEEELPPGFEDKGGATEIAAGIAGAKIDGDGEEVDSVSKQVGHKRRK